MFGSPLIAAALVVVVEVVEVVVVVVVLVVVMHGGGGFISRYNWAARTPTQKYALRLHRRKFHV